MPTRRLLAPLCLCLSLLPAATQADDRHSAPVIIQPIKIAPLKIPNDICVLMVSREFGSEGRIKERFCEENNAAIALLIYDKSPMGSIARNNSPENLFRGELSRWIDASMRKILAESKGNDTQIGTLTADLLPLKPSEEIKAKSSRASGSISDGGKPFRWTIDSYSTESVASVVRQLIERNQKENPEKWQEIFPNQDPAILAERISQGQLPIFRSHHILK